MISNTEVLRKLLDPDDYFFLENDAYEDNQSQSDKLYQNTQWDSCQIDVTKKSMNKLRVRLFRCLAQQYKNDTTKCKFPGRYNWVDFKSFKADNSKRIMPQNILDSIREKCKAKQETELQDLVKPFTTKIATSNHHPSACTGKTDRDACRGDTNKWADCTFDEPNSCTPVFDILFKEMSKDKATGFKPPTAENMARCLAKTLIYKYHEEDNNRPNFACLRWLMDLYTLYRMFRNFNPPPKRLVVYAGFAHSKNLCHLLQHTQGYTVLHQYERTREKGIRYADLSADQEKHSNGICYDADV